MLAEIAGSCGDSAESIITQAVTVLYAIWNGDWQIEQVRLAPPVPVFGEKPN